MVSWHSGYPLLGRASLCTPFAAILLAALFGLACVARADDAVESVLANPPASGLVVIRVLEESQAAAAGLMEGDLLQAYAGQPVATRDDLARVLKEKELADRIELRLLRAGKPLSLYVSSGPLGIAVIQAEKGRSLARHKPSADPPDFTALPTGERFYRVLRDGKLVGFERRDLKVEGSRLLVDHLTRYVDEGPPVDLRFRLTLARSPGLPVQRVEVLEAGKSRVQVDRKEGALAGKVDGRSESAELPSDAVPTWAVELLALTLPRRLTACAHLTLLNEGDLSVAERYELYCAAKESVPSGGKTEEAFRFDLTRYGTTTDRFWVTADGRLVKKESDGAVAELADRTAALKDLPAGVSTALE